MKHPFAKHTLTAVLGVAVTIALAGCGPSKTAQCNKLIESINKTKPVGEKIQQEETKLATAASQAQAKQDLNALKTAATQSAGAFSGIVTDLDTISKDIGSVEVKDEKLTDYKTRYTKTVSDISSGYKEAIQDLNTIGKTQPNNPESVKALQVSAQNLQKTGSRLQSLARESSTIVNDLNTYCGAK